jgi:hypothetical protein
MIPAWGSILFADSGPVGRGVDFGGGWTTD